MSHVNAARGVGKHLEDVIFRSRIVVPGFKSLTFLPDILPFRLDFTSVVTLRPHRHFNSRATSEIACNEHDFRAVVNLFSWLKPTSSAAGLIPADSLSRPAPCQLSVSGKIRMLAT
jgi:hypothetical protein